MTNFWPPATFITSFQPCQDQAAAAVAQSIDPKRQLCGGRCSYGSNAAVGTFRLLPPTSSDYRMNETSGAAVSPPGAGVGPAPARPKPDIQCRARTAMPQNSPSGSKRNGGFCVKCSSNRGRNPGHDPRGEARGGDGATRAIDRDDKNDTRFRERRGGESELESLAWAMRFSAQ